MITSKDNEEVKYINKLRKSSFRDEEGIFIVEGFHLVDEAYKRGLLLKVISTKEETYNVPHLIVSERILKHLSNLMSPSIIGLVKIKENTSIEGNLILALDNIQDPGNLGTILRSAKAFNVKTILLSQDSVSLYNDKVIRSGQGLIFDLNIIRCNLEEMIKRLGFKVLITDVEGGSDINDYKLNERSILVMGSEGRGVSEKIKKLKDEALYIKMNKDCESLNVAVAASIIMHHLGG